MSDEPSRCLANVAEDVANALEWRAPADRGGDASDPAAEVCAFVAYLRGRPEPHFVHTPDYVALLRSRATDRQRDGARDKLGKALEGELIGGAHSNPVTGAGADTLFLGADENFCRRLAESVFASRSKWGEGPWGTTRGICELLARLLVLPEAPAEALIPLFGWLSEQIWAEWEWARTWSEAMLGSSGHNWWLHTFLGFFEAGLWFPEIRGFARFRALAPDYFEREMDVLMEADGFTRERSGYHWGTAQHFYDYVCLADANGIPVSAEFRQHLRAVAETEWKALTPDGDIPLMGDSGGQANVVVEVLRGAPVVA